MSKISTLAESIKTTSQQEAQNIEQELKNDFERTRQNISDFLNQEANTIKTDIRQTLELSAANAVEESNAATREAAKQIADTISTIQRQIQQNLHSQETKIANEMIEKLSETQASLLTQAAQLSRTSAAIEQWLNTAHQQIEHNTAQAKKTFDNTNQIASNHSKQIQQAQHLLDQAISDHCQTMNKIHEHITTAQKNTQETYSSAESYLRDSAQRIQTRAKESEQNALSAMKMIDREINSISETLTHRIYKRTYQPVIIILYILVLLFITAISSCSIHSNMKTANEIELQIQQKQQILATIQQPIDAATASQLSNLVTISQTEDGILIRSKVPALTETVRKDGMTARQSERSLLIRR